MVAGSPARRSAGGGRRGRRKASLTGNWTWAWQWWRQILTEIPVNCLKLKRHWTNVCWIISVWVSSVQLPGPSTAGATTQPQLSSRRIGCRGKKALSQQRVGVNSVSAKDGTEGKRLSAHEPQRPEQKSKDKREHVHSLSAVSFSKCKFRKNTSLSAIIPFPRVRKHKPWGWNSAIKKT